MIRFVDLFAGIGGIRLGVEQALNAYNIDSQCVLTCEIDKHAQATYQANFNCENYASDITLLPETDVPSHDLLLAGFPCQPFSQAGLKRGFEDTRGTLFFDIERILIEKRPQSFLLENVKQLKGHDKGRTLRIILNHLDALGYEVHTTVLNAKEFGVPQNRERLYLVGFLKNPDAYTFQFPTPSNPLTKVGHILEAKVAEKYTISDALWHGHQRRKAEHQAKGYGFGYSLFDENSVYTSTISARYYKDGSEILIAQENKNPRKLTPREAARLQGFPDSFQIPVSDTQAYKQFGNSVAVPVVQGIIEQMIPLLKINSAISSEKILTQVA
ncbi:MAG: DNA cytosine methyltransferase [Vampirovibrio sp.]|nr:DNA cytosine methyltransferase [Vampirovibrio sp.]